LTSGDDAAEEARESLNSVDKFDVHSIRSPRPHSKLKALSVGRKILQEKGPEAAIPFFNRALELDPNFAAAYSALGISYTNAGSQVASENLQKAMICGTR
jgi:Flp pilus assembly protein TadD